MQAAAVVAAAEQERAEVQNRLWSDRGCFRAVRFEHTINCWWTVVSR